MENIKYPSDELDEEIENEEELDEYEGDFDEE